jgi:hypothetical protein
LDSQRYCEACSTWYHISCLDEDEKGKRVYGPLRLQFSNLTIARGWTSSPAANWMTVGTGRLVKKAREISQTSTSHDWEKELGHDFFSFVADTSNPVFPSYSCPHCAGLI